MITFQLLQSDLLDVETDLLVIPIFNDLIPLRGDAGALDWRLNGTISKLIKRKKVSGVFEEIALVYVEHKIAAGTALLIGFGKLANIDYPKLRPIYSYLGTTIKAMGNSQFALSLNFPYPETDNYDGITAGVVEGLCKSLMNHTDYNITIAVSSPKQSSMLRSTLKKTVKANKLTNKISIEEG